MMRWLVTACAVALLSGAALAQQPVCSVQDPVHVYWARPGERGEWYPARVLRVNDTQTRCYVAYDGYDSSWNEWVGGDRLRRAVGASSHSGAAVAATRNATKFSIAHVQARGQNWVFVKVGPRFLTAESNQVRKWYTDVQACVRRVNLAGDVVAVSNVDGRFRYWGPVASQNFLSNLDMNWVNARVNKEMTCVF
jgi:hypothetical protein